MQTRLHPELQNTEKGKEAERILRSCVHCGFCTATCPTYQELSDERDGPRGRIYLIKLLLENNKATEATQTHLDRCLTCRSCETTCPSGVEYGRLLDIGRELTEEKLPRPPSSKFIRWVLRKILPYPSRFALLLKPGQLVRPVLPQQLKQKIPVRSRKTLWPEAKHKRKILVLSGCAQSVATPNTNESAARVLDKLGISLMVVPAAGCCGAVSQHLSAPEEARQFMRNNIDAWWPYIEEGVEAIISTASGCGVMLQDYGYQLCNDPAYADKAKTISSLIKDLSDILLQEDLSTLNPPRNTTRTAFHCPCTLQHGMKRPGQVERVLRKAGISLVTTKEKHLCCGSAGTYSILQPSMSQRLLSRKLDALTQDNPQQIVTANIGCQLHLQSGTPLPVRHWIELLDV